MQCYICKKFRHTKAQCWYNEANITQNVEEETHTGDTNEEGEEGHLFMASANEEGEASQV